MTETHSNDSIIKLGSVATQMTSSWPVLTQQWLVFQWLRSNSVVTRVNAGSVAWPDSSGQLRDQPSEPG
jgi:hypothetical protein